MPRYTGMGKTSGLEGNVLKCYEHSHRATDFMGRHKCWGVSLLKGNLERSRVSVPGNQGDRKITPGGTLKIETRPSLSSAVFSARGMHR